jgi:hypothetical protein
MLWPDPRKGPWLLTVTWGSVNGRVEVVGLEMRSAKRSGRPGEEDPLEQRLGEWLPPTSRFDDNPTGREPVPVSAEAWRSVPVGRIVDELRAHAVRDREDLEPFYGAEALRAWRRPRSRTAATLEDVAAIYRQAWQAGDRKPTTAVAERLKIAHSTAAKRVQRAREAGLLPATTKGRAVGSPVTDEGGSR